MKNIIHQVIKFNNKNIMKPQQLWLWKHPAERIIERCNSKKQELKTIERISINEELSKMHNEPIKRNKIQS